MNNNIDSSFPDDQSVQNNEQLNETDSEEPLDQGSEISIEQGSRIHPADSSFVTREKIFIFLGIVGSIVAYIYFHTPQKTMPLKTCDELNDLEQKFPKQDKYFWKTIKVAIENIQNDNPPQPAVFLMVHSNSIKSKNLITRITEVATICLDSHGGSILLDGDDFQNRDMINDNGLVITKYVPELEKRKVMFVHDVAKIPDTVISAFHVLCDIYSPPVKNAALFFTLDVPEKQEPLSVNALHDYVEERLYQLWKNGLVKDKIQPLIARMTDTVLYINTN